MNHYFKMYLKNAAVGAVTGAAFGMVCGSGAGVSGLKTAVAYDMQLEEDKTGLIVSAALVGSATGASIGAVIGAIAYPFYEMFLKKGFPAISNVIETISVESVAESFNGNRRLEV